MLGFDDCDDNFIKTLGRNPEVDYVVGPFYCGIDKYSSGRFGSGKSMQRCVGGHQTHFYLLNYTNNVLEMNPDVNA